MICSLAQGNKGGNLDNISPQSQKKKKNNNMICVGEKKTSKKR